MIDLSLMSDTVCNAYNRTYQQEGYLELPNVILPSGMNQETTTIYCIQSPNNNQCEIYISEQIVYNGSNVFWQRALQSQVIEGARCLISRPDFIDALRTLGSKISSASKMTASSFQNVISPLTDMRAVSTKMKDENPRPIQINQQALATYLNHRVLGMPDVIDIVTQNITLHLTKSSPRRPSSICLMGPTGVGKTELVRQVASALKSEDVIPKELHKHVAFLRLDMGEFNDKGTLGSLLGASPGYIGHDAAIPFLDILRARKYAVVLFDEIEKAHADVWRFLLGLIDEGRVTPRNPIMSTISCTHAMFFFTSNLSVTQVQGELEQASHSMDDILIDSICRKALVDGGMQPEIVGRFTRTCWLKSPSRQTLAGIIVMQIKKFAEEFEIKVAKISPDVVIAIYNRVRATSFGVRTYQYAIEQILGNTIMSAAMQANGHAIAINGMPVSWSIFVEEND